MDAHAGLSGRSFAGFRLLGDSARGGRPEQRAVAQRGRPSDEYGASASSPHDPMYGSTLLAAGVWGVPPPAEDVLAQITIGRLPVFMGPLSILPQNGAGFHMSATLAHEIGHAMGIVSSAESNEAETSHHFADSGFSLWDKHLFDANGDPASPGQEISHATDADGEFYVPPGGYVRFTGDNVDDVLQFASLIPGTVNAVPINGWEDDKPEFSHIELRNSMMSHQNYRNWGTYMEAELAILQDIGFTIDRKAFYGRSVYQDGIQGGAPIDNYDGYSARNAAGTAWLPGVYSTVPLGIGLHIYGSNNTVRQFGEILTNGYGAAGIRVDGLWSNTLSVMPGVRVHANGVAGTGLMVAYGSNHNVIHRGDLSASGPGGVGARFDFGSNMLGNDTEYRGSYIQTRQGQNIDFLSEQPELNGPLVERFDVTGSIAGSAAALYISENAYVKEINLMAGASLSGDILSRWNPDAGMVQAPGDPDDLITQLTFGRQADADDGSVIDGTSDPAFSMEYRGLIEGRQGLDVYVAGGKLAHLGDARVHAYTLDGGAELASIIGPHANVISAETITFAPGSRVSVQAQPFSYGPVLGDRHTVLRLDSPDPDNQSAAVAGQGAFAMGAYDYEYGNVRWEGGTQLAVDLQSRRFNRERGGTSAVGAPLAMTLHNPAPRAFFERIDESFRSRGREKASRFAPLMNGPQGAAPDLFAGPGAYALYTPQEGPPRVSGDDGARPERVGFLNGGGELRHKGSALWMMPHYGYSEYAGALNYSLRTPAWSMGYDSWLNERIFLGLGLSASFPTYLSDDADVYGRSVTAALYGGARLPLDLELGFFASYGLGSLERQRSVRGERYHVDSTMDVWSLGVSLGREFRLMDAVTVRPFARYEYLHQYTGDWDEGAGRYALRVDGFDSRLHRLSTGAEMGLTFDNGAYAAVQAHYTGLYGDREARTRAVFTGGPQYDFSTGILPPDRDSLGIGLSAGFPAAENVDFSFGYGYLGGVNTQSHQGYVRMVYRF